VGKDGDFVLDAVIRCRAGDAVGVFHLIRRPNQMYYTLINLGHIELRNSSKNVQGLGPRSSEYGTRKGSQGKILAVVSRYESLKILVRCSLLNR